MGIIIYQIGIFFAIQISTFYGGKSTRNVAIILIAVFTILQVFTSQLMILQFFTIFISYLVSRNILGKSNGKIINTVIEEVDNFVSGDFQNNSSNSIKQKTVSKPKTNLKEKDLKEKKSEELDFLLKSLFPDQEKTKNIKNENILETNRTDIGKISCIISPFIENQNKNVPKKGYHPDRVRFDDMERELYIFAQTSRRFEKFVKVLNSLNEGRELKDFLNWNKKVNLERSDIYLEFIYKFYRKKK
jgi:hypothetical protein